MNILTTLVLILTVFVTYGCSLAAPKSTDVAILASDPNADIYVDGNLIGKSPQQVPLSNGKSHSVMAKCGDSAGTGSFNKKLSGTGVADIIGGVLILVPFIGLASDGAYTLEPQTLSVAIPDATQC